MLWIILVSILVGLIILLSILRYQNSRAWALELQRFSRHTSERQRQPHNTQPTATTPHVRPAPVVQPQSASVEPYLAPSEVITRRMPTAHQAPIAHHSQPQTPRREHATATSTSKPLNKPAADLPIIDFNDPALVRTRERTRAEVEKLSAELPRVNKPRVVENVKKEPEIIDENDIRANLLRQRLARRRYPNNRAGVMRHPRVIQEEEVIANLAKTDSPVNRRLRRISTAERESVLPHAATLSSSHVSPVVRPRVSSKRPYPLIQPHQPINTASQSKIHVANNEAVIQTVAIDLNAQLTTVAPTELPKQAARHVTPIHVIQPATSWSITDNWVEPEPTSVTQTTPEDILPSEIFGEIPEDWFAEQTSTTDDDMVVSPSPIQTATVATESTSAMVGSSSAECDFYLDDVSSHTESSSLTSVVDESITESTSLSKIRALAESPPVFELIEESSTPMPHSTSLAESTEPYAYDSLAQLAQSVEDATETRTNTITIKPREWVLPSLDLLQTASFNPDAVPSEETLLNNSITIEEKLAEFRVRVKVVDAYAGPVITRYEIEPDVGVRGSSVLNLEKDLARSLGVSAIRVVETIPGKTCMGLELPNPQRQMIRLSEIFAAPEFQDSPDKLTLALGQDITGKPVVTNLAKAPHMLVAGTTGSGKSVGVNAMILSILFRATPDEVRLIMIDPKMLELSIYEGIPHLLTPVVTDMKLAANALNWCVNEMERRYRLMSHVGVRNLDGYNTKIAEAIKYGNKIANPFSLNPSNPEPLEKLPLIVVVVDEFADLMMTAGKKIEELIARLAQKARAAGIHLILATQRPSVDVITGLIKANIPTRIAFQVSSKIDSRTILDKMGAENLLGQGDMLFLPPGVADPQRIHGAFASDDEVHHIVDYLKQFGEPDYIDDIVAAGMENDDGLSNNNEGRIDGEQRDPLYDEAVAYTIKTQRATTSSIQRFLRIGFNRAANLMEQMEADNIVSAPDGANKRTVLVKDNQHLDT